MEFVSTISRNNLAGMTGLNLFFLLIFGLVSFAHPWFLVPLFVVASNALWMMFQLAKH
jgi:hypothetical protein